MENNKNGGAETKESGPKPGQETSTKTPDILWKEAIIKYTAENNITVKELELAGRFDDADTGVDKAAKLFKDSRHPKDKKDKVITAVGGCLDWIDTTVDFLKDAVPDGYGTPAKVVAGAISYMIEAAKNLTEDFDLIEETFESINEALKDIGLLKYRHLKEDHFTSRLMAIFTSLFDFSIFSAKMFKKYSRRRLYIRALLKGRNEEIMDKCDHVKKAILLFRATVPLKILDVTERMDQKIDELPNTVILAIQDMKLKSSDLQRIFGDNKPYSVERIVTSFKRYHLNIEGKALVEKHMEFIQTHFVPNTFSWVKKDPKYKDWSKGQSSPFLFISGSSGAGKTFFTYKCHNLIQETIMSSPSMSETNQLRQNTSVACFLFEPGKEDSQSFENVLATIILQIAEQDAKLCDSTARELEKASLAEKDQTIQFLWDNLILKKFEKTSETSRLIYILLDGLEQMDDYDLNTMLRLFQALDGDKISIRIMMTGPPEMHKKIELKSLSKIDLNPKTKSEGDIGKIVDHRIQHSDHLRSLGTAVHDKIRDKAKSWTRGVMSWVDLMMSLLEQSGGDETSVLKKMDDAISASPEWLYGTMIEVVMSRRSEFERKSLQRMFLWLTYAKQPLSVHQLQHVWTFDPSLGKFDVKREIQGKSSSVLFTTVADSQFVPCGSTVLEVQQSTGTTSDHVAPNNTELEYVSFRQPAFKDYLENQKNDMIEEPTQAKVDIFLTLCGILCSRASSGAKSREALQVYATTTLIQHLKDIDIKKATPAQGRDVVEAISQILSNENDICTVFELVMTQLHKDHIDFELYDVFATPRPSIKETAGILLAWAKKMNFHEDEELSPRARAWVERIIKEPERMLEDLGCGHLDSWARKVTFEDAEVPYRLAFRSLYTAGLFRSHNFAISQMEHTDVEVTAQIATELLSYGQSKCLNTPVKLARARISAALLLNKSQVVEDRKQALHFHEMNLKEEGTPGPEIFYSSLGIAEYYNDAILEQEESEQDAMTRWEMVLKYADQALQQRQHEKGALGSELDNERCTTAFLLKAQALSHLNDSAKALETCKLALEPDELEFTPQILEFLTMIVTIQAKAGQHANLIEEVRQKPHRVKCEWMSLRSDDVTDKDDPLRKAAVLTRRVDSIIQLYEQAIEYWQGIDILNASLLQYSLCLVYRQDARTTKMAEYVLDDMLDAIKKNPAKLKGGIMQVIFPQMVDILFELYNRTYSTSTKIKIITKLSALIIEFKPGEAVEPIALAQGKITLAKMWKGLGDQGAQQATIEADQAFQLCVADLEDSVGWNDSTAFRVLARVLMFEELKHDAEIALSLQFSEVREYDDSEPRLNRDIERPAETDTTAKEENLTVSTPANISPNAAPQDMRGTMEFQNAVSNGTESTAPEPQSSTAEDGDVMVGRSLVTKPQTPPPEDGGGGHVRDDDKVLQLTDGISINGDNTQLGYAPQLANASVSPANPSNKISEFTGDKPAQPPTPEQLPNPIPGPTSGPPTEITPPDDDEDLVYAPVECNGPCANPEITNWKGHPLYYFCLDCSNVDLCQHCYDVQENHFIRCGEGFWFKCCWRQHEFLQQPIKGWRGVKNGVIRIDGKSKPWPDWLDAVKDKWARKIGRNEMGKERGRGI